MYVRVSVQRLGDRWDLRATYCFIFGPRFGLCFVKDRTNLEDRLASLRAGEKHALRLGMLFLLGIEAVWVTSVGAF